MIIGRKKEIEILTKIYQSQQAEFLAIYGRRRIGKTYLIHEYFKDKGCFFEITGSNKATKAEQLRAFHREYTAAFAKTVVIKQPTDWADAFDRLLKIAHSLPIETKFILFIDELPWLASPKSGFLAALDYFWNRHFSRMANVIVIVCGSAAHWMIQRVVFDKGGLHGRLSAQIPLRAFTLSEAEQYLMARGVNLTRKQLIELYMAVGGVAKYLSYATPGTSAAQIINEICFSHHGALATEFPKLYSSLFNSPEKHISIVRALAKATDGLEQKILLKTLGMVQSGATTLLFEELHESGFIAPVRDFGKRVKERVWRLIDEYSLFYLYWLENRRGDTTSWLTTIRTPEWYVWAGHAFESLCFTHIHRIKQALGIAAVRTTESHWRVRSSKGNTGTGVEVDLVIDRSDDCIHLCEMKFVDDEYEITAAYAKELERKRSLFREYTATKKALFITFITPYGLKNNGYSRGIVDHSLTMDALF